MLRSGGSTSPARARSPPARTTTTRSGIRSRGTARAVPRERIPERVVVVRAGGDLARAGDVLPPERSIARRHEPALVRRNLQQHVAGTRHALGGLAPTRRDLVVARTRQDAEHEVDTDRRERRIV